MQALPSLTATDNMDFIHTLCENYEHDNALSIDPRKNPNVKRGLRNEDGTGVMAGYTQVGNVQGYAMIDGEKAPMEGRLIYRGYDIMQLISGFSRENRFGFEEIAYLLLLGKLPNQEQYDRFRHLLFDSMTLPRNFTEDMILKHPSRDIMNKLARSVLSLYSSDPNPDDISLENMIRQCIELIARFPIMVAHAYAVKRHYFDNDSLYLHRPKEGLSIAENFLRLIRPDMQYSEEEARLLDLCLVIHAEHGGGNNSTFSCRVLSSTGTDTYSAIAAAVGSLKGPKHGGANRQVMSQFEEIKANVRHWDNDEEVAAFLRRILNKEVCDHSGLIYGMGHAIYTKSDPRTLVLKRNAKALAKASGNLEEFELMESVERLSPALFAEVTGKEKIMCANVDMYSGLVYQMMDIPPELYTPMFAIARVAGWCAHRIEEAMTGGRIIRPAYKAVAPMQQYTPMDAR
ncbi:MAG: citrate/2-methylcitrate synthase [Oscillospiraceae bacterium]|nr:citrate/2-methylcitrate synthase [Oscillospiraceae bacterium]